MGSRLSAAVALPVLAIMITGCGRQVSVEPPPVVAQPCATLAEALPDSLDGAGRRPTTPTSAATAAWGEPPIVMRCGVGRPNALTSTSVVFEVDTVTWFPEPLEAGTVFTTVDWPTAAEPVYVEVVIPSAYSSPGAVVADLSAVLPRAADRP